MGYQYCDRQHVDDPVQNKDSELLEELRAVLNRHSAENGSDTADFVLAEYLLKCLQTFDYFVRYRESLKMKPPEPEKVIAFRGKDSEKCPTCASPNPSIHLKGGPPLGCVDSWHHSYGLNLRPGRLP